MKQSFSTSVILKVVNPELDSGDLVNESLRMHEILQDDRIGKGEWYG